MTEKANDKVHAGFVAQSAVVKATAIDTKTGVKASIIGSTTASREGSSEATVRKLQHVPKKRAC